MGILPWARISIQLPFLWYCFCGNIVFCVLLLSIAGIEGKMEAEGLICGGLPLAEVRHSRGPLRHALVFPSSADPAWQSLPRNLLSASYTMKLVLCSHQTTSSRGIDRTKGLCEELDISQRAIIYLMRHCMSRAFGKLSKRNLVRSQDRTPQRCRCMRSIGTCSNPLKMQVL